MTSAASIGIHAAVAAVDWSLIAFGAVVILAARFWLWWAKRGAGS